MKFKAYDKRINTEILELLNLYNNIKIKKETNNTYIEIIIKNTIFKFNLSFHYPFNSPELMVNNKHYITFLSNNSKNIKKELEELNIECICCKTKLCSNNWRPCLKLNKIIEEYFYFKKIVLNIYSKYWICKGLEQNNIFCNGIKQKILNYIKNE